MKNTLKTKNEQAAANTIASTKMIKSLISELDSKKIENCRNAYQSLLDIREPAVQPLVEALSSPQERIRWLALKLLEELNSDWTHYASRKTINALIGDLASENGFERRRARRALVSIGTEAVEALIRVLSDKRENLRWEAAKALSQIGDPSATSALIKGLKDKNFDIRWLAAEGLISIGEPALVPLLHELIDNAKSVWFREGAHLYLREAKIPEKDNPQINSAIQAALQSLESDQAQLKAPLAAESILNLLNSR